MKKLLSLIMLLSMLPLSVSYAIKVDNLYQAEVAVSTQSPEARAEAAKEGLAQVLVKVSGDSEIMKSNAITEGLGKAEYYVQEYSYSSPSREAAMYQLRINYDPTDVKRLLRNAGVRFWGQNRPLILVWLVVDKAEGQHEVISSETPDSILSALRAQSKTHGIPIIFPMMDVTDVSHVSPNDIASKAIPILKDAGKRYGADAILVGKIDATSGELDSQWQLVLGKDQWNWAITDKTPETVVANLINQISQALAQHFVNTAANDKLQWVSVEVNHVLVRNDLDKLMRYLSQLGPVQQIRLSQVVGDMVQMSVLVDGTSNGFRQNAAIGQHLVLKNSDELRNKLIYDWVQ